MKKRVTLLLCSVLLGSVAVQGSVFAADNSTANVNGSVTFHEGDGDGSGGVIPPDNPGGKPEIPEGGGSEGTGHRNFKINWVTDLDFGDVEIQNSEMNAMAKPVFFKNNNKEYAPYIQLTDIRSNPKGWSLSVSATEFSSNDGSKLKGSSILFKDRVLIASSGQTDGAPTVKDNALLMPDSGSLELLEASSGEGEGVWTLSFTDKQNGLYSESAGVKLNIPSSAIPRPDIQYTSDLTWTLVSHP